MVKGGIEIEFLYTQWKRFSWSGDSLINIQFGYGEVSSRGSNLPRVINPVYDQTKCVQFDSIFCGW